MVNNIEVRTAGAFMRCTRAPALRRPKVSRYAFGHRCIYPLNRLRDPQQGARARPTRKGSLKVKGVAEREGL